MTTDDSGEPARRDLSGPLPRESQDPAASQRRELPPSVVDSTVLIVFVVAYIVFAAVCTPNGTRAGQYPEILVFIVSGAISAHVLLFALWAGLGPGPVLRRIPIAVGGCLLVTCAEALRASRREAYTTVWAAEAIVSHLVLFCLFGALLWSVQRGWGWQLARGRVTPKCPASHKWRLQFSLRLLLLWMTLAACVLALWQTHFADCGVSDQFLRWWRRDGLRLVYHMLLFAAILLPTVVVPWITLAYRGKRKWAILAAGLVWGILTYGIILMYSWYVRWPLGACVPIVVQIQLGAGIAGFATALIFRFRGYRILRFKKMGPSAELAKRVPRVS